MVAMEPLDATRTETLLRGLQRSGLGVVYHDADLAVRLVENLPQSWPPAAVVFATGVAAVFDPFTAERVRGAKRDVLSNGVAQRIEVPLRPSIGGDLSWFELSFEPDFGGGDDAAQGLFVTVTDITQAKRREAALRDLLFEVSHRSRNMLAILQSILGQTAGKATSVAEFEEKFRGRIASIAQTQDLITYANWQSVRLRTLAEAQIALFADHEGVTPEIDGLDPLLSPNTTLHLGLALHELAANSAAFGVLGAGSGSIRLLTTRSGTGYRIEWIETPAHPIAPPEDDTWGFGRTVLQNVVPRALRTEAAFSIAPEGVHYVLDLRDSGDETAARGALAAHQLQG